MREGPRLTVDGIVEMEGKIVLIKRRRPPFQGKYALPGGFVEPGETVEEAVVREVLEETGLLACVKGLLGVYSDPARDPRGHTVSVVFMLEVVGGDIKGGDDAEEASLFELCEVPELAFDHSAILKDYVHAIGKSQAD